MKCTKSALAKLVIFEKEKEHAVIIAEEVLLLTKEIENKFDVEKQITFNMKVMRFDNQRDSSSLQR